MAKYFCKVNDVRGQFRITVPKALVFSLGWEGVEFVILERVPFSRILVRKFVDGKDLKSDGQANSPGLD